MDSPLEPFPVKGTPSIFFGLWIWTLKSSASSDNIFLSGVLFQLIGFFLVASFAGCRGPGSAKEDKVKARKRTVIKGLMVIRNRFDDEGWGSDNGWCFAKCLQYVGCINIILEGQIRVFLRAKRAKISKVQAGCSSERNRRYWGWILPYRI